MGQYEGKTEFFYFGSSISQPFVQYVIRKTLQRYSHDRLKLF